MNMQVLNPLSRPGQQPWHLLVLSAKSEAALAALTSGLVRYLGTAEAEKLDSISFTLLAGRELLDVRRALVCRSPEDAVAVLSGDQPERLLHDAAAGRNRKIALRVRGRTEPSPDAAESLYRTEPAFRDAVDRCAAAMDAGAFGPFVFEYALAALWTGWGLHPDAVVGEGPGERLAAHLAGALSLAEAMEAPRSPSTSCRHGTAVALTAQPRIPLTLDGEPPTDADPVILDVATATITDPRRGKPSRERGFQPPDEHYRMLHALGELVLLGVKIDWAAHFADRPVRRVPLPTYPFEPQNHWFPVPPSPPPAGTSVPPGRAASALPTAPAAAPAAAPPSGGGNPIETFLCDACRQLLGIGSIDLHDNVVRLGMDSLNMMQLSRLVGERFGVSISPHHLFTRPDLASLAEQIAALRPDLNTPSSNATRCAPPRPPGQSPDAPAVADLIRFVADLSDEEVDRMLMELGILEPIDHA